MGVEFTISVNIKVCHHDPNPPHWTVPDCAPVEDVTWSWKLPPDWFLEKHGVTLDDLSFRLYIGACPADPSEPPYFEQSPPEDISAWSCGSHPEICLRREDPEFCNTEVEPNPCNCCVPEHWCLLIVDTRTETILARCLVCIDDCDERCGDSSSSSSSDSSGSSGSSGGSSESGDSSSSSGSLIYDDSSSSSSSSGSGSSDSSSSSSSTTPPEPPSSSSSGTSTSSTSSGSSA